MTRTKQGACHGQRIFVSQKSVTDKDIAFLIQRGYGFQDGGESGLHALWCDGFVKSLDFRTNPEAELERAISQRKLVPYTVNVKWWDDIKRGGGALASVFGAYKPLLVAKRDKNAVTVKAMAEALSHIARLGV